MSSVPQWAHNQCHRINSTCSVRAVRRRQVQRHGGRSGDPESVHQLSPGHLQRDHRWLQHLELHELHRGVLDAHPRRDDRRRLLRVPGRQVRRHGRRPACPERVSRLPPRHVPERHRRGRAGRVHRVSVRVLHAEHFDNKRSCVLPVRNRDVRSTGSRLVDHPVDVFELSCREDYISPGIRVVGKLRLPPAHDHLHLHVACL
jgi:hypothetical protein